MSEITEAEWQAMLITLAQAYGWHHLHVRRSIGKGKKWVTAANVVGWPDLHLWNERQRRVMYVELKTDAKGSETTHEQDVVLAQLRNAGQEVYVWRPSDLETAKFILSPKGRPT